MLIVNVQIHVKPEYIKEFIEATINNVQESVKEPGIIRFDFLQSIDDNTKFLLVEVYRNENAPTDHKHTSHYKKWREIVEVMMEEPRIGSKFVPIYPNE